MPLQESGRGRETTGSFSMRAVEQSFLHSSSFPPHSERRSRSRSPSVCLLSRSPGSVNFPRKLPDLDERNDGTVSNGGESTDGRREEGRGAHDCIIRLNRRRKNKYKVCQASFLPTPLRASVRPATGRYGRRFLGQSMLVGWL